MGIFGRIAKMTQAKFNEKLDSVENPIELCNQHIRDMEENYREAELSSAQVIGNAHSIEKEIEDAKAESAEWEGRIQLAVSKGNDDLARKAIVRKNEVDKKLAELNQSYATAHAQAEKLKDTLRELKENIEETRSKRDELEARYKTAEASQKVNEIVADVSAKRDGQSMEDLERKVARKEAMAEGLGEIAAVKKDSLEDEFKQLGDDFDVNAELAKYKQKKD